MPTPTLLHPTSLRFSVLAGFAALTLACPAVADGPTGEQIYQKKCAACHGAAGEGVKEKYPYPLVGQKTLRSLTRYIVKSMPDDAPGTCTGEEAERVAAFVYERFYSRAAQARNAPPRIELARLTVRQYRNAVADLIGGFRGAGTWGDRRGLKAEYFNSRRLRPSDRALERIDPEVKFDFGIASPDGAIDPHEFSIRWEGSVLAPETGEYQFIVRSDQAIRLWVNDTNKPLIDATVKSSTDTEHKASLVLLGGRAYALRLEFSKAKQGVQDKKAKEKPPGPASVALWWQPPKRAAEVIPTRYLSPNRFPATFVVQAAFPPDDRSLGWERGTTISKAWDEATTEAALETAAYVIDHLDELAGLEAINRAARYESGDPSRLNPNSPGEAKAVADRPRKLREFCRQFAERAFRRPLTAEQQRFFIDRQFEQAREPELAVKRVVLLVLKSPRFLYREVGGGPDAYDVAARLSFALWDSLPDRELLDAAAAGRLTTREQVARQTERMLTDLRARAKMREFFLRWLNVDPVPDLAKAPNRFPDFDLAAASDLRSSLELFLDDVLWSEASDFRQLLLSESLYLNGRLSRLYGGGLPADAPFQKVTLEPGKRAGILTHPYLLATFAYTAESSPIHRGVFLARNVLGQTLRPPPEAFAPLPAESHPELTTRERVALQTRPQACVVCHGMINPLGFTLENFDAVGRFRDQERGKPIDSSGSYLTRTGELVKFGGVRDLAKFLAASDEVHDAFVEHLFHHLVQQPVRAFGPDRAADLRRSFVGSGFHVRKLVVEIVATAALTARKPTEDGADK
jgi:hypothetical protein